MGRKACNPDDRFAGKSNRLRFALSALWSAWLGIALSVLTAPAQANDARSGAAATVAEATCRIVDAAARSNRIPIGLLTRLVWVESRFQVAVTSPAGAQGIAQFMPGTAAERGLLDPFDPEQAIPKAAKLLADLARQFGNIGLAAAAYNAGPNRVSDWLGGSGSLPRQTQVYVLTVTGRIAEDWATDARQGKRADQESEGQSCNEVTAALRTEEGAAEIPPAPWGVQLSGNFSKAIALASFERIQQRYRALIGNLQPMVIGGILRSRGTRRFYRIMLPASSRAQADHLCRAIMTDGGACVALRT
jgi:hypothetical protein